MGHRHSKDEMLAAAADVARADGLAGLTFAKVAARLGTSDRMVVYYFPTKAVLEEQVAGALGAELMAVLDRAFGAERRSADELFRAAWKVLATPEVDPTFRLFLELVGQASSRRAPYDRLAREMLQIWSTWLAERVDEPTPAARLSSALALIARLDGLLLVRLTLGPKEARRAFEAMTHGA
jgi:AcrR family transcriptional regulator